MPLSCAEPAAHPADGTEPARHLHNQSIIRSVLSTVSRAPRARAPGAQAPPRGAAPPQYPFTTVSRNA